jgi:HD-GYP domain-containing protein (c-di-GMP phosphodiesterase class II)
MWITIQPYVYAAVGLLVLMGAFFLGTVMQERKKKVITAKEVAFDINEEDTDEDYDTEEKILALIQENKMLAMKWENINKFIYTLGAIKDREMLANSVARLLREEFNVPYCAILLKVSGVFKVVSSEGIHAASAEMLQFPVDDPMVKYFRRYPIIIVVKKNDRQFKLFSEIQEKINEVIIMPMVVGEEMRGMLWMASKPDSADFTGAEKKLLNYLGMAVGYMINNIESISQLDRRALNIITALAKSAEQRTEYSRGHSERVSAYAGMFARHIGMSYQEVETIKRAGLMHDSGKIGISEVILNKPDKLSVEEFEKVKAHPIYAAELIKTLGFLKQEQILILHHHERHDGKGYPYGLTGAQIPIGSTILSLADIFDALTRKQVYRDAYTIEQSLNIMSEMAEQNFESSILFQFINFVKERLKNVSEISENNM